MENDNISQVEIKKNLIDSWKRKSTQKPYVYPEGKTVQLNIKKFIPKSSRELLNKHNEAMITLDTVMLERTLFYNKIDSLCQYIDYYIEFYDPDKELPLAYLYIKNKIDSKGGSFDSDEFIDTIIRRFFRDTHIKSNVMALVEYNYNLDVTVDKKTHRVFDGVYDFTNDDAKRLLGISMVMKLVIPLISQYTKLCSNNPNIDISGVIVDIFMEIFYKMGAYKGGDPDELLKKLYIFTDDKINKHSIDHQPLWSQQSALRGLTENKHTDTILIKHLISNNAFKFKFDDNIIAFLKSIVETQLICTVNKVKYKCDPVRVDGTKDGNGLSSIDKLEQSLAKKDEIQIIKSRKALDDVIRQLIREYGEITEDELGYYGSNFDTRSEYQFNLLCYTFAKYFSGYIELKNLGIERHIKLLIICKRMLIRNGYEQLPWLMSSVTRGRTTARLLQNNKFISKWTSSSTYEHIMDEKYALLKGYNEKAMLQITSIALNNIFTYVEYDNKELTDTIIEFDEDKLGDELLNFFDLI